MLIDLSSVSCTIILTNMSSLRELSLGVSICIDKNSIGSFKLDSFKTQVLIVEKFLTVSKPKNQFCFKDKQENISLI